MNWDAIKYIYKSVLVEKAKIKYIGEDKYIITTFYSSDKKRSQIEYKNGWMHGKSLDWFENGSKHWEIEYKNGLIHGKSLGWREDGSKRWEAEYKNGVILGKSLHWFIDGKSYWK